MGQIARRPGDEEKDREGATEPVAPEDPNELVVEGPDGRRLVVRLPEIRPPRADPERPG